MLVDPRIGRHRCQCDARPRRHHQSGSALRDSLLEAHARLHGHRDSRRRARHWRHDRDVFHRRSCDVAAAAIPRRRPRRPGLGGSLLARVSAHGAIAAEPPRLAAHGHGRSSGSSLSPVARPVWSATASPNRSTARPSAAGISDPEAAGGASGAVLTEADVNAAEGERPIVISDRLWRTRFGASPDVLGQTISLDDRAI